MTDLVDLKVLGSKHGDYKINRNGDVYDTIKGVFLEHKIDKRRNLKYVRIRLNLCGIKITRPHYIHQLLAQQFLENPYDLYFAVKHIDNNKLNNNLDNLMWYKKAGGAVIQ